MTREEKQLLLKVLCMMLPYGVKIHINSCIEEQNQMTLYDVNLEGETIGVKNEQWAFRAIPIVDREDNAKIVKPYLRPMSSMTEEERKYYNAIVQLVQDGEVYEYEVVDWLNAHHFDYRGLIPMGLALEAPKDMYKTE